MEDLLINVFDMNFNRLGVIDTYIQAKFEHNYHKHSELILTVEATDENVSFLLSEELRILTKSTDINRGFIIETAEYVDEKAEEIEVIAKSLSIMVSWRIILGQQRYTGNVENVIKSFVSKNAISPSDNRRAIPNLVSGVNEGINITTDEIYANTQLDESVWEICEKYDISYEILMNHEAKKYVFSTYQGLNRSAEQTQNPHIIFSKDFENILKQSYVRDVSNLKTTAVVFNEDNVQREMMDPETGEPTSYTHTVTTNITVNGTLSGFNRKEIFVESNAQRNYDVDGTTFTISESEFRRLLEEDGKNVLAERIVISSFESEVDAFTNSVYGEDYFLGDKVSIKNDKLRLVLHTRIAQAVETYDSKGYSLKLAFGTNIPTFIDKVKREVKRK